MSADQPTVGFIDTMSRVLTDAAFRDQLLADPDAALGPLGLAPSDREYIAKIAREHPHLFRSVIEDRTGWIVATWGVIQVKHHLGH